MVNYRLSPSNLHVLLMFYPRTPSRSLIRFSASLHSSGDLHLPFSYPIGYCRREINDWLNDFIRITAPDSVEYVGAPKGDDLGDEGRPVRFQQPVEFCILVNTIKKGSSLPAGGCSPGNCVDDHQFCPCPKAQLGRSAHPRRGNRIGRCIHWKWWSYIAWS